MMERAVERRTLRRWQQLADEADALALTRLKETRARAAQMRRQLNRLCHVADGRLALPYIGSNAIQKPAGTEWAWRPELWRGPVTPPGMTAVARKAKMGGEVSVFHDCRISELTLRQVRNNSERDLAPFGLRMDVFQFDGSFLSLAVDLPPESVVGLTRGHLIGVHTVIEMERPLEIFARLNIRHGPNTENLVRELPLHQDEVSVEFDLAYVEMNEKRVERAWLDLIFEGPEMNQVILHDITMTRRPRAEL